jgi:N-acetylglucosamine-6-phosphate deacetylase
LPGAAGQAIHEHGEILKSTLKKDARRGERIYRREGVGIMPDGQALASSVMGMDHGVQTFHRLTGIDLPLVVRMATLTPARIAGHDPDIGSIVPGKKANLLVLDDGLRVKQVYLEGKLACENDIGNSTSQIPN